MHDYIALMCFFGLHSWVPKGLVDRRTTVTLCGTGGLIRSRLYKHALPVAALPGGRSALFNEGFTSVENACAG